MLRFLLARLVGHLAVSLVRDGARHATYFADRGGDALLYLLEACRGEQAVGILRAAGASIGSDCVLVGNLRLVNADRGYSHLRIGDQCHLGKDVMLDLADDITLGDRVTVSMRCSLLTHTDAGAVQSEVARTLAGHAPIVIEDDVYLGAGCIVLSGVRIGSGSVIGAGSLVNRDVPGGSVYVGVPARPISNAPRSTQACVDAQREGGDSN